MKKVQLAIFDFNGVLELNGKIDLELLEFIAQLPIKTAILTGADLATVKILLLAAGSNPFDEIFTRDITMYGKPSPQAFNEVATRMDLLPEECVMIDDSPGNVAGAEKAGMHSALYIGTTQLSTTLKRLQII